MTFITMKNCRKKCSSRKAVAGLEATTAAEIEAKGVRETTTVAMTAGNVEIIAVREGTVTIMTVVIEEIVAIIVVATEMVAEEGWV